MAARKKVTKKSVKSAPARKTPSKAAHHELFENHPNLKILLFLFAAVAVTFFILSSSM